MRGNEHRISEVKDMILTKEVIMEREIRASIQTVYRMLWEILALYEKTDSYNSVPEGEKEVDVWDYMREKLVKVRKIIAMLFHRHEEIQHTLYRIVDETEEFVRKYERPGVAMRWKKINQNMLFFDAAFDIMESCPEIYREMRLGLSYVRLACYPDEELIAARKKYFEELDRRMEEDHVQYSDDRIFQDEVLRTLTLVFQHDLKDQFDPNWISSKPDNIRE